MEHLNKKEEICRKVAENFRFAGKITKMSPYGSGHINDTFMLTCELEDGSNKHYILQRMNDDIFRNPKELMENVVNVTTFLRKKIIAAGGDPERETLNIILTKDGASYLQDEAGDYWRSYVFIDDATCFDLVEKPEDFYNSAVAFGHFQQLLADYPAATLHETIKNFHNTVDRFHNFLKAVEEDVVGRAKDVQAEIEFVKAREADCHIICDALAKGLNGEISISTLDGDDIITALALPKKSDRYYGSWTVLRSGTAWQSLDGKVTENEAADAPVKAERSSCTQSSSRSSSSSPTSP